MYRFFIYYDKTVSQKIVRIQQLVDTLRDKNGASIKELSSELGVSEMTVRRDLEQLRQDNIISLVHGAAIFKAEPKTTNDKYTLSLQKIANSEQKERIGKAAARLVNPGDTIMIDIGTTTEMLAKNLSVDSPITVICFTMNVLQEVYKKRVENLIMGGGYYHPDTQLFEAQETVSFLKQMRASKYFMSAAGINPELGLTCANQYEVGIKQACINSSLEVILLADSAKFGKLRPAYFASLKDVDLIITDDGLSEEWRGALADLSIKAQVV
jgi:DeoR family deoxyribose operon repressor